MYLDRHSRSAVLLLGYFDDWRVSGSVNGPLLFLFFLTATVLTTAKINGLVALIDY